MEWIRVQDKLPEEAMFCLVSRSVLSAYTDENLNNQYELEVCIIYYFKERNVTGWEKDWTNKPSSVQFWMPLPSPPKQKDNE